MRARLTPERRLAEVRGREGEAAAAQWLVQQGWEIAAERVKTKVGEIDLVARRAGLVAFVEVKWRARGASLAEAIDERRLARVAAAAEVVMHRYAAAGEDVRIDVILLAPGRRPYHIANAWMP